MGHCKWIQGHILTLTSGVTTFNVDEYFYAEYFVTITVTLACSHCFQMCWHTRAPGHRNRNLPLPKMPGHQRTIDM